MTAPRLTPRTQEAMQRLGIVKDDLVLRTPKDFLLQCKGNLELAKRTADFYVKRRENMCELVQKERETIVSPAPFVPLPLKHNQSTVRRSSDAVAVARKQAAVVMEHRARSVMVATHRTEARIARIMQAKEAAVAQKKKESMEVEIAKREKIESLRQDVLKALDEQMAELVVRYEKRDASRQEALRVEKEHLARENEEEDVRRRAALYAKKKIVENHVTHVEAQQEEKNAKHEEHIAEERVRVAGERKGKFLERDKRHAKALVNIEMERERVRMQLVAELEGRDGVIMKTKEVIGDVVKKHMESRKKKQKEALDKVYAATMAHEKSQEALRDAQVQKTAETENAVEGRRAAQRREWADKSLTNLLKHKTFQDNLKRSQSQSTHRLEEKKKEFFERERVWGEQASIAANERNELVQRRLARVGPEVEKSLTPGPGHYLGTDCPWYTSRKTVITGDVGAMLPAYPTPAASQYRPRPSLILPHKGAPRM